jgi:hypothetical protein
MIFTFPTAFTNGFCVSNAGAEEVKYKGSIAGTVLPINLSVVRLKVNFI